MITSETIESLKAKVREHGQYRQLAEHTGLSESWISKFATVPGENYTLKSVQRIADYFGATEGARTHPPAVAAEEVIPIAEASGWLKTPHEIRPDLYPNPDDGIPPEIRAAMDAVVVGWREPADESKAGAA